MVKRSPKRVARRKTRRTKAAQGILNRHLALQQSQMDLEQRIWRIEQFLGDDLKEFHEKQPDKPALVVVPGAD